MFGKKAKEIKELRKDLADQKDGSTRLYARCRVLEEENESLKAANADQAQKLKNAEVLLQREQATTAREKKRADENYEALTRTEGERDESQKALAAANARIEELQVPLTKEVIAQAKRKK